MSKKDGLEFRLRSTRQVGFKEETRDVKGVESKDRETEHGWIQRIKGIKEKGMTGFLDRQTGREGGKTPTDGQISRVQDKRTKVLQEKEDQIDMKQEGKHPPFLFQTN